MRKLHRLGEMTGYSLNAHDGEIGKVKQVYFDDQYWTVRYFVIATGSWFLGKNVLIVPAVITALDEEEKRLEVDLAREQIKNAPSVDTTLPVSRHYEKELLRYYEWERYWISDTLFGVPSLPEEERPAILRFPKKPEQPHLRSSDEVKSYSIHARDGDIGHVEDYILEEPDWTIRYLEVDTRNWLPGKHVLIDPTWIDRVDWVRQEVVVKMQREAIETAPPYDSAMIISRDYRVALSEHYGMKCQED